jgi:Trk-type K+ transport system membrane component
MQSAGNKVMEQEFDAKTRKPRNSGIRPGWLLIGSFALMVLVGTCLLKLPIAVVEGKHLNWLDALFTSTSAVCVTGLVVENTAEFFSRPGQIILMGLIQLGGLGIMTLTFYLVSVMTLRLSFKDRQALGEMISEKHLGLVAGAVRFIVLFTFVIESLGALWLYVLLPESLGGPERVFQACFHSVSAFCNAGFSTFPGGLADPLLEGLTGLQLVITGLVILGGLGAMVLRDGLRYLLARLGWRSDEGGRRLRLHSRVVMMTTGWLLIGGAIAVGLFEFVFICLSLFEIV